MSRRPEWVHCIQRDTNIAWCGRDIWMEWRFMDLAHAENTVANGDYVQPCGSCLKKARKASARGGSAQGEA